jgi:hypothetical protein
VKLVLATADAFAKFGARASSGAASRILRQKTSRWPCLMRRRPTRSTRSPRVCVPAAFAQFSAQATSTRALSRIGPSGHVHHGFPKRQVLSPAPPKSTVRVKKWTRTHPRTWDLPSVEKVQTVIKNPEKRLFTSWLEKPTPSCLILEVSGCKRCGREVTTFIATFFSGHLQCLALLARGASNDPRAHLLRLAVASFARLAGPDQPCDVWTLGGRN